MRRIRLMARAAARRIWICILFSSGALRWAERQLSRHGVVLVLTFHRVLTESEYASTNSPEGMLVKKDTFARLIAYLARSFKIVTPEEAAVFAKQGGSGLRLALTFDDGWEDNYRNAAPMLQAHSLPAAIFVCPALVGQIMPFWPEKVGQIWRVAFQRGLTKRLFDCLAPVFLQFPLQRPLPISNDVEVILSWLKTLARNEREHALQEMERCVGGYTDATAALDRTMTWSQIDELAQSKVAFGSHSHSHELLTNITSAQARDEVCKSRTTLEQCLGVPCTLFAYPNGDWSEDTRDLVQKAGFKLAFANKAGAWVQGTNEFVIPRVNIWEGAVTGIFGRFSSVSFRYVVIWRALRALRTAQETNNLSREQTLDTVNAADC